MYCIFYANGGIESLHVGDGARDEAWSDKQIANLELITWIQADGHELEAIQKKFTGPLGISTIPMPQERVCRWYGDIARTIHLNLISHYGLGM